MYAFSSKIVLLSSDFFSGAGLLTLQSSRNRPSPEPREKIPLSSSHSYPIGFSFSGSTPCVVFFPMVVNHRGQSDSGPVGWLVTSLVVGYSLASIV